MVWFLSDLHLNHKGILEMCRGNFSSVEEHNEYIIKQYNSVVQKDDLVYILGDLGFTPQKELKKYVEQLNGRKILIIGNHDKLTDGEYRSMGFIDVVRHPVYYNSNIILSHVPVQEALNNRWVINVHGHLHSSDLSLPNYLNVNVELNNYLPTSVDMVTQLAESWCRKSRFEKFGQEWYYNYYNWKIKK